MARIHFVHHDDPPSTWELKLAHCPRSLAPTLVALPSISLIPFARFLLFPSYFLLSPSEVDGAEFRDERGEILA